MTLDEYQKHAAKTAIYPGRHSYLGLMYTTGKLNGEAGEVAELIFKGMRDDNIVDVEKEWGSWQYNPDFIMDAITLTIKPISEERRLKVKKELGDILWYVAETATQLGYNLSEIAIDNVERLASRKERGVLKGSGSDR